MLVQVLHLSVFVLFSHNKHTRCHINKPVQYFTTSAQGMLRFLTLLSAFSVTSKFSRSFITDQWAAFCWCNKDGCCREYGARIDNSFTQTLLKGYYETLSIHTPTVDRFRQFGPSEAQWKNVIVFQQQVVCSTHRLVITWLPMMSILVPRKVRIHEMKFV